MGYDPHIHHRRSIRLKGYDYSRAGLYFITICTQDRAHLFGYIANGKMVFNAACEMVAKWYVELQHKFPFIRCHEMVVMPNHFHCILEIVTDVVVGTVGAVGADLRVCPVSIPGTDTGYGGDAGYGGTAGDETRTAGDETGGEHIGSHENGGGERINRGEHIGSPLHVVLQWFKTMTTNEYIRGVKTGGWKRFNGKLWQRNYWEHIIRNEQSYHRIAQYIQDNPRNWETDRLIKRDR